MESGGGQGLDALRMRYGVKYMVGVSVVEMGRRGL